MNRAVFLDRDGTIARDVHYCRRPEDFEILPTVPEAIRLLNENGFKVAVITNQSGVARGYFTEEMLAQIHGEMEEKLAEHGAHLDAIYYCPHHPDEGCECRKPKTALFLQAAKELDIDLGHSFVVGDMQMDVDAGKALGCKTVLVTTGPNPVNNPLPGTEPDYVAGDLYQAVQWIVEDVKSVHKPSTSIIVPAYNEEEGLPVILEKICNVVNDSYEVIVVDDGSNDATAQAAARFPCRLVKHEVNKGKGEAIKTGIKSAAGDNIILIDADDTYPADAIPHMAEALKSYDMVYGSRLIGRGNVPLVNRFGNAVFQGLVRYIYGFKPRDYSTGLYGARKKHLQMMDLSSKRFAIEPEICIKGSRMGLKMLDIPIQYRSRIGTTKLSAVKAGFEHLKIILGLVFWQPDKGKGDG